MRKVTEDRPPSGMAWVACTLVVLMVTTMAAAPANAGLVTHVINFSASPFIVDSGPDPAPVDPVLGSVTLTFDPTVLVIDNTADITLNSLNIVLDSAISFSYDPALNDGFLRIGGLNSGSGVIISSPSTNDFFLNLDNVKTTLRFYRLGYTQTSVSNDNLFITPIRSGSATIVPEPSTFALASLGSLALMLLRRRARR